MRTEFDIGEKVCLKAEVSRINIEENNVEYNLRFVDAYGRDVHYWINEEDLINGIQGVSVDKSESKKTE